MEFNKLGNGHVVSVSVCEWVDLQSLFDKRVAIIASCFPSNSVSKIKEKFIKIKITKKDFRKIPVKNHIFYSLFCTFSIKIKATILMKTKRVGAQSNFLSDPDDNK